MTIFMTFGQVRFVTAILILAIMVSRWINREESE